MRILCATVCAGAILASSSLAANAVETMKLNESAMVSTKVTGDISGVGGVKLNCAGTTAQIHNNGKPVADVPTTSDGSGGCKFDTKVETSRLSPLALTSCAGKVSLADANERLALASSRTYANGHEKLGMLGTKSLYSTVASGDGSADLKISVGSE